MKIFFCCLLLTLVSVSAWAQEPQQDHWQYFWPETLGASIGLGVGVFAGSWLVEAVPGIEFSLLPQILILGGAVAGVDVVAGFYNVSGDHLFAFVGTLAGTMAVVAVSASVTMYCQTNLIPSEICQFLATDLYYPSLLLGIGTIAMATTWGYNQNVSIVKSSTSLKLHLPLFSLHF